MRSRASASSPVCAAISAGVAPVGSDGIRRAAVGDDVQAARGDVSSGEVGDELGRVLGSRPEALAEAWRYWLAARCKSMVMPRLRR